jgi:hypothetical protein
VAGRIRFLVTVETDPTRHHGEHPQGPVFPGAAACEQLLAHLKTDIEHMFPETRDCSLVIPGALYDQTQVLRPQYPLFSRLAEALKARNRRGQGAPASLALCLDEALAENDALRPDPSVWPGLMQNLPVLMVGEPNRLESIADAMEHRFLEEGQLSAHSARALESHFGVAVNHARFMTLTDLRAMLKLQLEHFRFGGLWELLDGAIEQSADPFEVRGRGGQRFEYRDGVVHCTFECFDYWAQHGGGMQPGTDTDLEQAYTDWTREYRQYVTTLQAHQVPLAQHPAAPGCAVVEGDYLVETSANDLTDGHVMEVTVHGSDDTGVIAVSVIENGRQRNLYPLSAAGLNAIYREIRRAGLGPAGFAYTGRIVHDPERRRLQPDTPVPNDA